MIQYITDGDLFGDDADALTNTVNCKGLMGKGVALAFAQRFPDILPPYEHACESGTLRPGVPIFLPRTNLRPGVLLFPTKDHWRKKSRLEWIDAGLISLRERADEWRLRSIAMPQLGCGLGGLAWHDVQALIEKHLSRLDLAVRVYVQRPAAALPAPSAASERNPRE